MLEPMDIKLSEAEMRLVRYLAKRKGELSLENELEDRKVGNQSNEETDLEGIGGELAFCKLFNIYPDLSLELKAGDRDRGDAVLLGHYVDVKTTSYSSGRLLVVPWKKGEMEFFALMTGKFPVYQFRGLASREELMQESNLTNLGYGSTYALSQSDLQIAI